MHINGQAFIVSTIRNDNLRRLRASAGNCTPSLLAPCTYMSSHTAASSVTVYAALHGGCLYYNDLLVMYCSDSSANSTIYKSVFTQSFSRFTDGRYECPLRRCYARQTSARLIIPDHSSTGYNGDWHEAICETQGNTPEHFLQNAGQPYLSVHGLPDRAN